MRRHAAPFGFRAMLVSPGCARGEAAAAPWAIPTPAWQAPGVVARSFLSCRAAQTLGWAPGAKAG
eukprot:356529-Chlamydomonas_euryale.AAC.3